MIDVKGPSQSTIANILRNIDAVSNRLDPKGRQILVGVPADAGEEENGLPIATNAFIHEFGIGVPERSFLRAPIAANMDKYKKAFDWFVKRCGDGKISIDNALGQIGFMVVGDIQSAISQGINPPNAPETIRRKKSSTPLIDTGRLRQSITFRIVEQGEDF